MEGISKERLIEQWIWMMEYCQKKRIPPAQAWAWEEAKKAYEKELNNGRD